MNMLDYVSQDVAKMLKEKGFNESCFVLWDEAFEQLTPALSIHSYKNQDLPNGYCSAPSLIDTLGYLEKKGVHIEIRMQHCKTKGDPYQIADDDEYQWKWYYAICKGDDIKNPILEEGDNGYVLMHPDMVSCLRAAIRKGVELL